MDTWIYLSQGFAVAMTPENLVIALIGCFVGTIVGLLPGLGPINGVAILLPLAFALHLPAESALILLATVYIGCEYGGRISSILLNVPGDAAAIMTGAGWLPDGTAGSRRRGAVHLRGQFVLWFTDCHRRYHSVCPCAGPVVAGVWSGRVFALMVFAIAVSAHGWRESAEIVFVRADWLRVSHRRRGCQHRGLSPLPLTACTFPTACSLSWS